jgi:hypothetical protein
LPCARSSTASKSSLGRSARAPPPGSRPTARAGAETGGRDPQRSPVAPRVIRNRVIPHCGVDMQSARTQRPDDSAQAPSRALTQPVLTADGGFLYKARE